MLFLVANLDPLTAGADEVFQRRVQIERVAHLVKVGHRHVAAQAHRAPGAVAGLGRRRVGWRRVRLQLAQNQLEQRGFARAVGAQQTDLVTPQHGGSEVLDNHASAGPPQGRVHPLGGPGIARTGGYVAISESLGHMHHLGHQLAALVAAGHVHVHAAHNVAPRGMLGAQLIQAHDAGGGPGAPGFHALANPHLFLRQELVSPGVDDRFLRQLLFFLQQIGGKVAGVGQQLAPVQLHDAGGHVVQKRAVVGDGDDGALELNQQALQPFNRVQVQMVGRLVQQQHIGLRHQRLRQRYAFFGTTRQGADNRLRVQVQSVQRFIHPLLPVPAVQRLDFALHRIQVTMPLAILFNQADHARQTCADSYKDSSIRIQLRLLRHVGNAGVVLHLQRAVVGLFHAAQYFEHAGLARAIAANQAHALLRFKGKISVVEQGNVSECQLCVK